MLRRGQRINSLFGASQVVCFTVLTSRTLMAERGGVSCIFVSGPQLQPEITPSCRTRSSLVTTSPLGFPPVNPQLHPHVWKQFKQDYPSSLIFSPFNDARHLLVTGEMHAKSSGKHIDSACSILSFKGGLHHFPDLDRSWLHLAVLRSDLPLACEAPTRSAYRLQRPSWALRSLHRLLNSQGPHARRKVPRPQIPAFRQIRDRRDARLPIPRRSPLRPRRDAQRRISSPSRVLYQVLAPHPRPHSPWRKPFCPRRTLPHKLPIDMLNNPLDKFRLAALVSEYSTIPRPSHPCLCASGRPLSECHTEPTPPRRIHMYVHPAQNLRKMLPEKSRVYLARVLGRRGPIRLSAATDLPDEVHRRRGARRVRSAIAEHEQGSSATWLPRKKGRASTWSASGLRFRSSRPATWSTSRLPRQLRRLGISRGMSAVLMSVWFVQAVQPGLGKHHVRDRREGPRGQVEPSGGRLHRVRRRPSRA
ncbi:hypothetical protein B0H17DRAFT_553785 [Mycena rosella]|uniref:Uncharacterized protein n=1 Tax=Mycena rosella TaxID=1033263 RepID=A0AAD7DH90_MYCRO|nr:hypothetical protein B0H17DRAFT_553785 [Mycena rosella]